MKTASEYMQKTNPLLYEKLGDLGILGVFEAMEEYANQSKWISVDDRLPQYIERVIVYSIGYGVKSAYLSEDFSNQYEKVFINGSDKYNDITHWQPLLAAPLNK